MTSGPIAWVRSKPEIASHDIVTRAVHRFGSLDFELGDRAEPLEVLCRSLDSEADLTIAGRRAARRELIEIIVAGNTPTGTNVASTRSEPSAQSDTPLIVVTGLVGSGARELALDRGADVDRVDRAAALGFVTSHFEQKWHVPSFAEWLAEREPDLVVRSVFDRLDAATSGDESEVIYSPQLIEFPAAILKLRPNATIIQVHRRPEDCAAAIVDESIRSRREFSNAVDPIKVSRYWAWRSELALNRNLDQRETHPEIEQRITDIDTSELNQPSQHTGPEWTGGFDRYRSRFGASWL